MHHPQAPGLRRVALATPQRWFLLGLPVGGLLAFILGAGAASASLGGLHYTSTESFCTSCHEMTAPFQEYRHSAHYSNTFGVQATCADCHIPPSFTAGLLRHVESGVTDAWEHMRRNLTRQPSTKPIDSSWLRAFEGTQGGRFCRMPQLPYARGHGIRQAAGHGRERTQVNGEGRHDLHRLP